MENPPKETNSSNKQKNIQSTLKIIIKPRCYEKFMYSTLFIYVLLCYIQERVGWLVALVYSPLYSFNMNVNLQTTNSFGVIFFQYAGVNAQNRAFVLFYRKREISENFVTKGRKRKKFSLNHMVNSLYYVSLQLKFVVKM